MRYAIVLADILRAIQGLVGHSGKSRIIVSIWPILVTGFTAFASFVELQVARCSKLLSIIGGVLGDILPTKFIFAARSVATACRRDRGRQLKSSPALNKRFDLPAGSSGWLRIVIKNAPRRIEPIKPLGPK